MPSQPCCFDRPLWTGGRFSTTELGPYILAQVAGGLTGAAVLYIIVSGQAGFDAAAGFAANGYGEHSPSGYSLIAALVTEIVMTFMFLMIILGATDKRAPQGFAPIAIGPGLTLIHLITIPVTNTSVNPARSTDEIFHIFITGGAVLHLLMTIYGVKDQFPS